MVFIILTSVLIISLFLSRILFKRWFNPLAIYTIIWFVLLFLYELKLLRYYDLNSYTWFIIILSFLSFLIGIFFYFSIRSFLPDNSFENTSVNLFDNPIFAKNGKILFIAIIVTALIGLTGALQHWNLLLKKFGSLENIFIYANIVYRMRVEGVLQGIAYLPTFSFVSIFLAGLYSAYKNKISLITLLPLSAIILKDLANVGRVFMLFGLIEFLCVFLMVRYVMKAKETKGYLKSKKSNVINFIIIIGIIILSASFVRSIKGQIESYKTATSSLKNLNVAEVITPSIYLYFSSDIGVLKKYLEHNSEFARWGENTFMPLYSILAKFKVIREPRTYQKAYYIPMWSNTGTYLRELHADFGIAGIILGPFLLGFLSTFFFFKFLHEKKIEYLIIETYLYIIIFFTFLMIITRTGNWLISLILTIIIVSVLQKIGKATAKN